MADEIALTVPAGAVTGSTRVQIAVLVLDVENSLIHIELKGENGLRFVHKYSGAPAATMMTQLNTANLSTRSLQKRILDRLVADGAYTGTITG